MLSTENNCQSDDMEPGFSDVKTENGQIVRIFALSAEEFEKAKPKEEVFRRVAAIMADQKAKVTRSESEHKARPTSNAERIQRIVRG